MFARHELEIIEGDINELKEYLGFKRICSLQEVLENISEENYFQSKKEIIDLGFTEKKNLKSLVTDIIQSSSAFRPNFKIYLRLIEDLNSECDIYTEIQKRHNNMLLFEAEDFFIHLLEEKKIYFNYKPTNEKNKKYEKIIKDDDVDELIKTVSEPDFHKEESIKDGMTFIEASAYYGSIKCFKYLIQNDFGIKSCDKYAPAGGNIDIIQILEQNKEPLNLEAIENVIKFHRREIFDWLMEKYNDKIDQKYKDILLYSSIYRFAYGICQSNKLIINTIVDNSINCGFTQLIQYAIEMYPDYKFDFKKSLNQCCYYNHQDIFQLIYDRPQNPYKTPQDILKFLIKACEYDSVDIVEYILSFPDLDVNGSEMDCPLVEACNYGSYHVVDFLLKVPNINIEGTLTRSPLIIAAAHGFLSIVQLLINAGCDINRSVCVESRKHTAFTMACKSRNIELINMLLEYETIDPNGTKESCPLVFACIYKDIEIINLLLSCPKIDINNGVNSYSVSNIIKVENINKANVITPFVCCCAKGFNEGVELLIKRKDFSAKPDELAFGLKQSCANDNIFTLNLLLTLDNIDVNGTKDDIPLYSACKHGHKNIVEALLNHPNIKTNKANKRGFPLLAACSYGHTDIVKMLIKYPDTISNNKQVIQSYQAAVINNHLDVVKVMLQIPGIDVNGTIGICPFVDACKRGRHAIVKYLIKRKGIDVNLRCKGESPLFAAFKSRNFHIVYRLLDNPEIRVTDQEYNKIMNHMNGRKKYTDDAIARLNEVLKAQKEKQETQ